MLSWAFNYFRGEFSGGRQKKYCHIALDSVHVLSFELKHVKECLLSAIYIIFTSVGIWIIYIANLASVAWHQRKCLECVKLCFVYRWRGFHIHLCEEQNYRNMWEGGALGIRKLSVFRSEQTQQTSLPACSSLSQSYVVVNRAVAVLFPDWKPH